MRPIYQLCPLVKVNHTQRFLEARWTEALLSRIMRLGDTRTITGDAPMEYGAHLPQIGFNGSLPPLMA